MFPVLSKIASIPIHTAREGTTLQAIGIGTVRAKFELHGSSGYIVISNVLFVPELAHSLLPLAKLVRRDIRLFVDVDETCYFVRGMTYFGRESPS